MNKLQRFLGHIFEQVPTQEKINFVRHLAIVIKSGLPLLEGLKIIRRQTRSNTLLQTIDQLIVDVNNGQFLADSLERHRHLFGDFFINIIRVGEASGTLAVNLLYLAGEMRKSQSLRGKVRSALIYPIVIFVVTVGVTALLTFFVFPKVLPVFASLRITLPLTTRILIAVLSFILHYGWWLLGGLVLLYVVYRILLHIHAVRYMTDRFLLSLPIFSTLSINLNMANFTRVLEILLKSGVKIVEAIQITSQTSDNLVYQRAFLSVAEKVRKGEPLASMLVLEGRIFPSLATGMIEIGENTGNLGENLAYLSEYYTEEVENAIRDLTSLIEPMLLLVMGLLVGFVALSIITPIYEVTSHIGR